MTTKIIYGTDTGSIEDYSQCVVVLAPDELAEDADALDEALNNPETMYELETQTLVTWEDTVDALLLAMRAEGIDTQTQARIIATVRDAVDNND
jgi:predicted exporter